MAICPACGKDGYYEVGHRPAPPRWRNGPRGWWVTYQCSNCGHADTQWEQMQLNTSGSGCVTWVAAVIVFAGIGLGLFSRIDPDGGLCLPSLICLAIGIALWWFARRH